LSIASNQLDPALGCIKDDKLVRIGRGIIAAARIEDETGKSESCEGRRHFC